ncbi:MAG: BREX system P-loop protein BrxC, partial [Caldilinea sp.]
QALSRDGKFPLTLLVLDEVQQFIGNDPQRANEVQEAVEACCKNIGSHLLFVATGQTAVTGTAQLARLQGRFTIRVELSDADVDAVVRQVILAKQPNAIGAIDQVMTTNLGEVARHLAGATIAHRQDDIANFAKDYPILPVRRRFWEQALRALDPTGADSQLRNQLTMVHKAVQTNLDQPLGNVIAADYLYFDSVDRLLQARILPRNVRDETVRLHASVNDGDQLTARAVGLIFLINKLNSHNKEMGLRATVDTLADLMVTDLPQGSSALRSRLPALLNASKLLMRIDDEYRIQTDESRAWNDEFAAQVNQIANDSHSVETERNSRLRTRFSQVAGKLTRLQGYARTPRSPQVVFDDQLPADAGDKLYVWVRSGWTIDRHSVQADARQAGSNAPTVFVFLPRRSGDDLRTQIINYKAAANTLDRRGAPNSPEGIEARAAIETIRQAADRRINELIGEILGAAHIYQGGGAEVFGDTLPAAIEEAVDDALVRLYSEFRVADQAGWEQAYTRAQKGASDALRAIGYMGEAADHPVCKKVLALIGAGKRGEEVRKALDAPPYGWPRDAIDGALQVLLVANLVRATDDRGRPVEPTALERKAIGRTLFKVESTIITVPQRLELRKLFTMAGVPVKAGEESAAAARYVALLEELAASAGGEAPKPAPPAGNWLKELRLAAGNEQLLAIYNQREELARAFTAWTETVRAIAARWPAWQTLQRLVAHLDDIADAEIIRTQAEQIRQHRQLLTTPDLVQPLIDGATQMLRTALNNLTGQFDHAYATGWAALDGDDNWRQLTPDQQSALRATHHMTDGDRPMVDVASAAAVLATLDALPLPVFDDRIDALPRRFADMRIAAAKLVEPQTQFVSIPRPTIRNTAELDVWLAEVRQTVATALEQGPVSIG